MEKRAVIGDFVSGKPVAGGNFVQGVVARLNEDVAAVETMTGTVDCRRDNLLILDEKASIVMENLREFIREAKQRIGPARPLTPHLSHHNSPRPRF